MVLTRWLEMRRGGQAGNQASPVITMQMMNGSGANVGIGDVVVLQKTGAVGGTRQVETATIAGTITTAGNATLIITAADMTGSPITLSVAVALNDTATICARKFRDAMNQNVAITELFTVTSSGTSLIMTSKYRAANDSTLNINFDDDTSAGLTGNATSTNTTSGVAASGSTPDLLSFTTTTSANNLDVYGMVYDTKIYPGTVGNVLRLGPVSGLKVDGTADIAIGDYIGTYTTAKIGAKTSGAGAFAVALEAYATNDSAGVIDAYVNCFAPMLGSVTSFVDNAALVFGTGSDVSILWNGTNLTILPVADDTGAILIGDGTTDMDVKVFLGTSTKFVLFDVGNTSLVVSAGVTLSVDDTTDTSSTVTGSIHTDGGVGIAKALWVGTTSRLVGAVTIDDVATFAGRDVHSAGLTVASDFAVVQGMNTFPKLTVTVLTSAAGYNMTAAQLLSGCISDTSATGPIAATLPSVASTVALIPGYVAGTAFYLDYRNPGNQTVTLTVDAGAQWTLVGTMTIATVTHKRFLCVINSATTGTIYSVGASTA